MKKNVGLTDKIIRIILAAVFVVFGIIYSYYWFIAAVIALGTALVGWCGLYNVIGVNTCPMKKTKSKK